MIPNSSEFFNRLQILESNRTLGITHLRGKGIDIGDNASIPSIIAQIPNIDSASIDVDEITLNGNAVILTAELANITITLKDDTDTVIESKGTGASGGVVSFIVPNTQKVYTLVATDIEDVELWVNEVEVIGTGTFNCKTGKPLADYEWGEIKEAGNKNLARYMWSAGDEKKIESFMGSTTDAMTTFIIAGFNHDEKVGGGFGITFLMKGQTSSTYQYFGDSSANSNGVSWVGTLIRQNCLRAGQDYYTFERGVTSSTSGTYYIWDTDNKTWVQKTLPSDFATGVKYYSKHTQLEDGAFWNGLSEDIKPLISQVKKKTWGGYGGGVTNSTTARADETVIETSDWLFTIADCEVFGDSERINNYSRWDLEGKQYDYFKTYQEGRLNRSSNSWTRSPYVTSSNYACSWYSNGYVNNYFTNFSFRVVLGFCL